MNLDMGADLEHPSLKDKVSPEEWETRCDLAALYRLVDHFGWNKNTGNHIAARVPNEPDHFLINPGQRLFSEITASSLVKLDYAGNILQDDAPTGIVNPAGHNIHAAIMENRPDINCAVHLHTVPGVAVSSKKTGLKFYCQESFKLYNRTSYHDYEGIARDQEEGPRLAADLGADNFCLILRNHGSLCIGRSIPEAFTFTQAYEKACEVQVAIEGMEGESVEPPEEVAEKTSMHRWSDNMPLGGAAWPAYRRIADKFYPSYLN